MKFEFKKNEVTGNLEASFSAKLVSVGSTILQNSNSKNYKIATVEFENAGGKTQRASAAIYEGNYSKGVTPGESYLTKVTISEGQAYLQMSHLNNAERATAADFGFTTEVGVAAVTPVIGE